MKQKTDVTGCFSCVFVFAFAIAVLMFLRSINPDNKETMQPKHECIDQTHKTCDGACECDGLECE